MGIPRDLIAQIDKAIGRALRNRMANLAARGVVQLVSAAGKLQKLQVGVLKDEDIDDAEHFEPYGFTSVPLGGAEAALIFPNGDRSHPIAVAVTDRRWRIKGLQGGEVAIYNNVGTKIVLKADGAVEITNGAGVAVPLATKADVAAIETAIAGATIAPNDGGASLQATIVSGLSSSLHGAAGTRTWPAGTTVLKAE